MNRKVYSYLMMFFSVLIFYTLFAQEQITEKNKIFKTCQFVQSKIFIPDEELKEWLSHCKEKSRNFLSWTIQRDNELKTRNELKLMNDILSELKVSHLQVLDAQENSKIWEGWDLQNGIESRFIDGKLVVTSLKTDYSGIKVGDIVETLNDKETDPDTLNRNSGKVKIKRGAITQVIILKPQRINENQKPSIINRNGIIVIKIPSFKAQFFDYEKIEGLFKELRNIDEPQKILIDLRKNTGGNFTAGLRLLSYFFCEPQTVGFLKKKKNLKLKKSFFSDNLNDEEQIDVLNQSHVVELKTFHPKFCIRATTSIMIDSQTTSTAEMVANAFREVKNAKIFGAGSSGQLLVGIWYDISEIWHQEIKITIPEAYYESTLGKKIEESGVNADQVIYDHFSDYQKGNDSWLEQVTLQLGRESNGRIKK